MHILKLKMNNNVTSIYNSHRECVLLSEILILKVWSHLSATYMYLHAHVPRRKLTEVSDVIVIRYQKMTLGSMHLGHLSHTSLAVEL